MNNKKNIHTILNFLIATVWIINGLFCKLFNLVPRHQLIISRILGTEHATLFTNAIGISEILMGVWIVSSIRLRLCSLTQVIIIAVMNTIEFITAPDLLLFGKLNSVLAFVLIIVILYNEFFLRQKPASQK